MQNLRIATPDDAEAIAAIYAPYVLDTAISFEAVPPTPGQMRERIARILATHPWLVFEDGGAVKAYAYASSHAERAAYRWAVDVAVYAERGAQRRGMGRALYTELIRILRRQGRHSAWAGIALPNAASVGLHEAMGFRHSGTHTAVGFKHGAWRDVGWWRRPLAEGPPKGEPIPFSEL
jgi:L-amino acid N-acyltransferase YncA